LRLPVRRRADRRREHHCCCGLLFPAAVISKTNKKDRQIFSFSAAAFGREVGLHASDN
jgi:hypothetical protein